MSEYLGAGLGTAQHWGLLSVLMGLSPLRASDGGRVAVRLTLHKHSASGLRAETVIL